ncbi:MAG TPA: hypothetical protein VKR22_03280 [Acidimicrobiales bacterium]|nr:hypothetical protein [Acidimicrobiales bacterium]
MTDQSSESDSQQGLRQRFSSLGLVQQILSGVGTTLVLALLGFLGHQFIGHHATSGGNGSTNTSLATGTQQTTTSQAAPAVSNGSSSTSSQPTGGCVLSISDPYTQIKDQPSYALQSGTNVPAGQYPASENQLVSWGGAETRWFKISVSGRVGWVPDDGIQIDSKTSACP